MPLTLIAQVDRRSPNRLSTPPCPHCGHDESMVGTLRSPSLVCFRCTDCGNDLVVNKNPGGNAQAAFGASAPSEA
jgi:hypothetical protein